MGPSSDSEIERLERFFAGECTPAEAESVKRWLESDPRAAALADAVRSALPARETPVWSSRDGWRRMSAGLPELDAVADGRRALSLYTDDAHRAPSLTRWRIVGLAAAMLVAVSGSMLMWRGKWLAPRVPFREFATARGGHTTIILRDGSRLVLGPATRVRVRGDFGATARTLEVDGEVLLTVVHDPQRPFVVRTPRTVVRDIGTTFVVRAYADDAIERVAVAEGQVGVGSVTLVANDAASIDAQGRVTVRRGTDLAVDTAWTQGTVAFQNTPLRDVVAELSRVYGVNLTIADSSLMLKPVTAAFRDEPVDVVLDAISFIVGGHYERTGGTVVIRRGVASSGHSAGAQSRTTR